MKSRITRVPTALLSLSLLAAACNPGPPDACVIPVPRPSDTPAGNGVAPLHVGPKDSQADSDFVFEAVACVGGYHNADGTTTPCGSATLITPNMLLTAKHLGSPGHGAKIRIAFGPEARDNPMYVASAVRCWDFRKSGPTDCSEPLAPSDYRLSDTALWQLDRRISDQLPNSYAVTPIPVAFEVPGGGHDLSKLQGVVGITVGYGSTDSCNTPQTKSGVRRFGPVRIEGGRNGDTWTQGDGTYAGSGLTDLYGDFDPSWAYTAPGDSGGPLLVNYGAAVGDHACIPLGDLRVVGTTYRGCNYAWGSPIYDGVAAGLKQILDPNGDGIQRGFLDGNLPGYIDLDGDGLAEFDDKGNPTGNDNCPGVYNPDQADSVGDGIGDACRH